MDPPLPCRRCTGPADPGTEIGWDRLILGLRKTTKEFIENVLENIIESIVITTLDGRLVFFNKFSEEMFGFRAHEVLNRHIAVLGAREPDVLAHIRDNRPFSGEILLRAKDGRRFPARVRCVPLRDEQDRPIAMVGVARDITREKEKEQADREVARLKAFNENIIASLNDGILIVDPAGRVTFANRRVGDLLGHPPAELLGLHYSDLAAPEAHAWFEQLLGTPPRVRGTATFETSFGTRRGERIPVLVSASPLPEGSEPAGVVICVTDISEIRVLKEELFQAEKMASIGALASEVAHEINNPLGGLIMAVQMLAEDLRSGAAVDAAAVLEELVEIERDARRCKGITQRLLDFSRSVPEERTLLDLNRVVEDALPLVQRQAELENIRFVKDYDPDLPPVRGNANSLQQVVINLVRNARDAMPGGGSISLRTRSGPGGKGRWVRLVVADTGPGISPEVADRIFHSFFTTKGPGKGTGLGLAVSKRIVEEHGGRIGFENRPGGGSAFHVQLPAVHAPDTGG